MERRIKAVLFDLDGVLVHSSLDLPAIKRELFGDSSVFILEGLAALPPDERAEKDAILLKRELEAAESAALDESVPELFSWMESVGLKRGVITRNSRDVVKFIEDKLNVDFGVVVGREDALPKPDPAGILMACDRLGIDPADAVMVGDYIFDIEAGRRAGCRTVFLETEPFRHLDPQSDVRIASLDALKPILHKWLDGVEV